MSDAVCARAAADSSRVVMDLAPGENLAFLGLGIRVEFIAKSGRHARLCVIAPKSVQIDRQTASAPDTSMAG